MAERRCYLLLKWTESLFGRNAMARLPVWRAYFLGESKAGWWRGGDVSFVWRSRQLESPPSGWRRNPANGNRGGAFKDRWSSGVPLGTCGDVRHSGRHACRLKFGAVRCGSAWRYPASLGLSVMPRKRGETQRRPQGLINGNFHWNVVSNIQQGDIMKLGRVFKHFFSVFFPLIVKKESCFMRSSFQNFPVTDFAFAQIFHSSLSSFLFFSFFFPGRSSEVLFTAFNVKSSLNQRAAQRVQITPSPVIH